MELADHAQHLLDMAIAQSGGRTWMFPEGIPKQSLSWQSRNHTGDGDRQAVLKLPVLGYTENGYGDLRQVHIPFVLGPGGLCDTEALAAVMARRIAGVIARHEKLGHIPARYDEFEPDISHLRIDPVFGRHLDRRYGADAPRIAGLLVGRILRRERPNLGKKLPKGSETIDEVASVASLIVSGNVDLGQGVVWKSRTLVIADVILSDTIMSAVRGAPVSALLKHDEIGDAIILQMTSTPRTSEQGGGTTTIQLDIPVVPVRDFWPATN